MTKEKKIPQIPAQELELIAQNLLEKWQKEGLNTELSMICTECGNDIDLTGFLAHVSSSLLKSIVALLGKEFFKQVLSAALEAILNKLMSTRGIIDTSMAQLANDCEIVCPKCKKASFWKEVSAFSKTSDALKQEVSNQ